MESVVEGKTFKGLLDIGAGISVIAQHHWSMTWPSDVAIIHLQGIGNACYCNRNAKLLIWRDTEDCS